MENLAGCGAGERNNSTAGPLTNGNAGSDREEFPAREVTAEARQIPESIQAMAGLSRGVYDARRLRSQREIIRDVMLAASDCETWLTLGELRALTRYGESSISAQLRHLRKAENGGYEVAKRQREGVSPERHRADGRGECMWEYRISRVTSAPVSQCKREDEAVAGA